MWGNTVAAIVVGLISIPFLSDANDDQNIAMRFACFFLVNIVLLRVLYKAWAALPTNYARTTPGQAVGFIFVPFYNLYWVFNAYVGFAKDSNRYTKQVDPVTPPQPDGFYIAFCIFHFYVAVLMSFITPYILILDFFILTPIMVGIMGGGINALSRVAEKLSAARQK